MNAFEQAKSLMMISKLEAMVYLFKSEFPDLIVDLKPWLKNNHTKRFNDVNSIDIGFHFKQLDYACQCRSMLMQVRLDRHPNQEDLKAIGIELSGYETMHQVWRFSTIGNWQFFGNFCPLNGTQKKLKLICAQIIKLFETKEENQPEKRLDQET